MSGWGTQGALPPGLEEMLGILEGAGINVPYNRNQGSATFGPGRGPQDLQNWLAGPLFTNQIGTASQTDMAMNLLLGQALQQGGRSQGSQDLLENLSRRGLTGPANMLNLQTLQGISEFSDPATLDALRAAEENQARAGVAGSQNAALNTLRDLGITGQGRSATGAVNQLSNLGNRSLQDQLLNVAQQDEQRRMGPGTGPEPGPVGAYRGAVPERQPGDGTGVREG
jgi:hypothetical protein